MDTDLDMTKDKDAELARWREQALQEDATANALRDQVASLTSLVKDLVDTLEKLFNGEYQYAKCTPCSDEPYGCDVCDAAHIIRLIRHSREVCK